LNRWYHIFFLVLSVDDGGALIPILKAEDEGKVNEWREAAL
jgi:hypothetical protein